MKRTCKGKEKDMTGYDKIMMNDSVAGTMILYFLDDKCGFCLECDIYKELCLYLDLHIFVSFLYCFG